MYLLQQAESANIIPHVLNMPDKQLLFMDRSRGFCLLYGVYYAVTLFPEGVMIRCPNKFYRSQGGLSDVTHSQRNAGHNE